jgi:hypothetical protein
MVTALEERIRIQGREWLTSTSRKKALKDHNAIVNRNQRNLRLDSVCGLEKKTTNSNPA